MLHLISIVEGQHCHGSAVVVRQCKIAVVSQSKCVGNGRAQLRTIESQNFDERTSLRHVNERVVDVIVRDEHVSCVRVDHHAPWCVQAAVATRLVVSGVELSDQPLATRIQHSDVVVLSVAHQDAAVSVQRHERWFAEGLVGRLHSVDDPVSLNVHNVHDSLQFVADGQLPAAQAHDAERGGGRIFLCSDLRPAEYFALQTLDFLSHGRVDADGHVEAVGEGEGGVVDVSHALRTEEQPLLPQASVTIAVRGQFLSHEAVLSAFVPKHVDVALVCD